MMDANAYKMIKSNCPEPQWISKDQILLQLDQRTKLSQALSQTSVNLALQRREFFVSFIYFSF